ncbi:putative toxin-antitoxin system toxin component, PIN family [Mucilaginibacter sp. ZT4R22]|uniref:Toxin-antitoxin system toxin component, PIN family n=2 Tax=Mucilaginibacter pankratovii TaxID=2772110 RepID=A0ABR7X1K2_9SPHI|nr:putative toxin-antitoxin system toxin component, PIN family [Mucilaginibacter pankratovii]
MTLAISRKLSLLYSLKKHQINTAGCTELFNEISEVSQRKKFKKYFNRLDIEQLFQIYFTFTLNFELSEIESIVSDQKDNYLFALCDASKADYLVTGDKLLLDVMKHKSTEVITLAKFRQMVSNP